MWTVHSVSKLLDSYGLKIEKTKNVAKNLGLTPVLVLAGALNVEYQAKGNDISYIRGYADAIATLFDKKGGQKVASLVYSYADMRKAGVSDRNIKQIEIWLET